MEPVILKCPPEGYWVEDGRGKWMGPFESDEEAERTARLLCPDGTEALEIRKLAKESGRVIRIPRKRVTKRDGSPKHPNRRDGAGGRR